MSFSETLSNTHKQHPSTIIKKKEGREREREREDAPKPFVIIIIIFR